MLRRLDDLLIDRVFEPAAHRAQMAWGATAFRLSSRCLHASLGLMTVSALSGLWEWLSGPTVPFVPVGLGAVAWMLAVPVMAAMFRALAEVADRKEDGARRGCMNELRPALRRVRASLLLMLPVFVPWAPFFGVWPEASSVCRMVGWTAYIAAVYWLSCTPLPPGTERRAALAPSTAAPAVP